jgi:hypothetical protein
VLATVALLILSLVVVPEATAVVRQLALALVAEEGRRPWAAVASLIAIALAAQALPTLRLGLGGWIRSLPLDHRQHRRATTLALVLPQAPVIVGWLIAIAAVAGAGPQLSPSLLLGFLVGTVAAGAVAVPVERGWIARPLALGAAATWTFGTWWSIGASLLLLIAWDGVAGAITLPGRASPHRGLAHRRIGLTITLRALGLRLVGPVTVAVVAVGFAWAYRVNNGFTVARAAFGTRVTVLVGIVLAAGLVADALLVRRRPWPWLRSLPTTARERVIEDGVVVAIPGLIAWALTVRLDWRTAGVVAAVLPTVALLAVTALRWSSGKLLRATGTLFWLAAPLVASVAIWPATAMGWLALAPASLWLAARADRRLVVTGWEPLHHAAAGDSLAGSAR